MRARHPKPSAPHSNGLATAAGGAIDRGDSQLGVEHERSVEVVQRLVIVFESLMGQSAIGITLGAFG